MLSFPFNVITLTDLHWCTPTADRYPVSKSVVPSGKSINRYGKIGCRSVSTISWLDDILLTDWPIRKGVVTALVY